MAELLTTTQGSTTTVHPWYQLFKTRLVHIAFDEITMIPTVEITVNEEEEKHFQKSLPILLMSYLHILLKDGGYLLLASLKITLCNYLKNKSV